MDTEFFLDKKPLRAGVESAILSGKIIERQKDQSSGEWKYLVKCESLAGESVATVTKIGPTDKLIIITVYRD
ncbi:MAG TPA: DUF4258 domain-containing protein [Anaerolineales bacterium]|nr:DUF4258 domain-containing protein [Anaerolineales bacterium]HQX18234.1 DUF4258 domain-containing protein [Anaerolineales bacterium]